MSKNIIEVSQENFVELVIKGSDKYQLLLISGLLGAHHVNN